MFCPNCGNKLEDNALFCGECGTRVAETPQKEVHQAPPVQQQAPVHMSQTPKAKGGVPVAAIIFIVQLLFTAALVVGLVLVINKQVSPKTIAENYWKATMEQQWGQAYEYCDFPDGEFMTKEMYINAMSTWEEPAEVNAYEIYDLSEQAAQMSQAMSDVFGEYMTDETANASESSIQKIYYINYVPKGGSDTVTEVVTVSKTKEKKFLFWTQWKVTSAGCTTGDISVDVPNGAKVTFNGVELPKEWATEGEDGITLYTIPKMFIGQYQVEITMDDMEPYRLLFNTYEGAIYVSHMEPTDEIKEQLASQLVTDAQAIVQAAMDGKSFESVEEYFYEEAIEENDLEEGYEELQELAGEGEQSGLVSYEATDIVVNYESCDFTDEGMSIQLSAKGNYKESKWREWYFTTPDLMTYDGEMSMWITYVNVDGEWKLTNLPLNNYDF